MDGKEGKSTEVLLQRRYGGGVRVTGCCRVGVVKYGTMSEVAISTAIEGEMESVTEGLSNKHNPINNKFLEVTDG